jgi:hypothetical protein
MFPPRGANAASDQTRPGCDHVISTQPATTAPTPGSLTQFWCDVVDGGVERLAVVGRLGVKRGDPLRQPDGLLPAGTQRGAFSGER